MVQAVVALRRVERVVQAVRALLPERACAVQAQAVGSRWEREVRMDTAER